MHTVLLFRVLRHKLTNAYELAYFRVKYQLGK